MLARQVLLEEPVLSKELYMAGGEGRHTAEGKQGSGSPNFGVHGAVLASGRWQTLEGWTGGEGSK